MRIVINDASCLIDLRKAGLLHAALALPFEFHVALPLVEVELTDFSQAEIDDLKARGLLVVDLSPDQVARAIELRASYGSLSIHDCFCISLSEAIQESMLLTGDQTLRNRATALGIEVHGVLWITDQLEASGAVAYAQILEGLVFLREDPVVFLPQDEVATRIERLTKLVES
jgi:hypothetical protein